MERLRQSPRVSSKTCCATGQPGTRLTFLLSRKTVRQHQAKEQGRIEGRSVLVVSGLLNRWAPRLFWALAAGPALGRFEVGRQLGVVAAACKFKLLLSEPSCMKQVGSSGQRAHSG
jgi:hypothetical protein